MSAMDPLWQQLVDMEDDVTREQRDRDREVEDRRRARGPERPSDPDREQRRRMTRIRDDYERLEVDSDFGHAKSYEWLRNTASVCFNPPDADGAEEEIVAQAMVAAAEYIAAQPCRCVNTGFDGDRSVPYDDGDQCARCAALGRYFDLPLDR